MCLCACVCACACIIEGEQTNKQLKRDVCVLVLVRVLARQFRHSVQLHYFYSLK